MAEENQNNQQQNVGVVGQRSPQQQQQQQQPQRGVPGTQQPPVPSPEQIAKAMAEQKRQVEAQMAVAQKRAAEFAKNAQEGQPMQVMILPNQNDQVPVQQQQIPTHIQEQMPPQMQQQAPQEQQPVPSPVPGMTAQEVLAGIPQQANGQSSRFAPAQQEVQKEIVYWHPARSGGVDVELADSIIRFVPTEGMAAEGDPQAKVVLALLSEIVALQQQVLAMAQMAQNPQVDQGLAQRVYSLEATLFEQRRALNTKARSVKEQIQMFAAQGMSADQIVANLQSQGQVAEQMANSGQPVAAASHTPTDQQAAAQADMVSKATGQE